MISDEKGKQLHGRATSGEKLSDEEKAQLEEWYALQDQLEMASFGIRKQASVLDNLQAQIKEAADLTIDRLRLNRSPLVAYRLRDLEQREKARLLAQYKELLQLQERLNNQLSTLVEEQRQLLEEQQRLLKLLLSGRK